MPRAQTPIPANVGPWECPRCHTIYGAHPLPLPEPPYCHLHHGRLVPCELVVEEAK